ncbi:MAG: MBL fold metallo-hydrolase [Deltaproteobacteria bacterium]|nr:MBL fold metallo-hydrolase [Candidatus Zymogenaceae bacterium]
MPHAYFIITSMPILFEGRSVRLPCLSTLVRHRDNLILFDTGLYGGDELVGALARLGHTPSDVTHVFNTHFHGDHAGANDRFPAAVKIARKDEFLFSRDWLTRFAEATDRMEFVRGDFPHLPDDIVSDRTRGLEDHVDDVLGQWWNDFEKDFTWLEDNPVLPGEITVLETPGHTPYHTSYVFHGETTRLVIAGDALSQRKVINGDAVGFEPHLDLDAHRRSVDLLLSEDGVIVPGHDRPFAHGDIGIKVGKQVVF